jgi:hypothetical protein
VVLPISGVTGHSDLHVSQQLPDDLDSDIDTLHVELAVVLAFSQLLAE